jgi:hypothetical protein
MSDDCYPLTAQRLAAEREQLTRDVAGAEQQLALRRASPTWSPAYELEVIVLNGRRRLSQVEQELQRTLTVACVSCSHRHLCCQRR